MFSHRLGFLYHFNQADYYFEAFRNFVLYLKDRILIVHYLPYAKPGFASSFRWNKIMKVGYVDIFLTQSSQRKYNTEVHRDFLPDNTHLPRQCFAVFGNGFYSNGAMVLNGSFLSILSQLAINSFWCSIAHSTTRERAFGGKYPSSSPTFSILILALNSPYCAWKCAG